MISRRRFGRAAIVTLEAALLLFIALRLSGYAQRAWDAVFFVYPLDYGEGPLLAQTIALSRLVNIYRPDINISTPPYTVANYTPLFMLVQTPFAWLFGPAYWYGRLISVLSALAAALFCGLILYAFTSNRLAATFGGLMLLAGPYVAAWSVYNRVDTLALALSLAALWVIVRWSRSPWRVAITAVLLIAAVYTRQTYGLAAPLAAFVWLLVYSPRRQAFTLAGLVAGGGLGLFFLLNGATDGGFYFNIITANANAYQVERLLHFFSQMWLLMPVFILVGGLFLVAAGWARLPSWWLIAPYLAAAALVGLTIGKVGASINYFFELSAALSLAAGALLAWSRHRPWLYGGLLLVMVFQMAWLWVGLPSHLLIQSRLANADDMHRLMILIEQAEGTVLADEALGFLPLTGRDVYIQPYEVTQLANDGIWDQSSFLTAIQQQQFSHIIMLRAASLPGMAEEPHWTAQMIASIERHYVPTATLAGSTVVYVPR